MYVACGTGGAREPPVPGRLERVTRPASYIHLNALLTVFPPSGRSNTVHALTYLANHFTIYPRQEYLRLDTSPGVPALRYLDQRSGFAVAMGTCA